MEQRLAQEHLVATLSWMGMQWTVTTPIYLKSVEFWTATFNSQYTVYVAPGKITEAGEPIFSTSGTATEIGILQHTY